MKHLLLAIFLFCAFLPPLVFAAEEEDPFLTALSFSSDGSSEEYGDIESIREAAGQGGADAQNKLGRIYALGIGVQADEKEAVKWFRKAADRGLADARFNLGCCCEFGKGVRKDEGKAVDLYRMAAEQGCAPAQFRYAFCLEQGKGVLSDKRKAVEWYRKAAEQGHADAQVNLALCYENGIGTEKDKNLARKWLRTAARQGNERGREKLLLLDAETAAVVFHHPSIVLSCGICESGIEPMFTVHDSAGNRFYLCSECRKLPHCEYCQVPAVADGDGVTLCRDCSGAAVEDRSAADSIFEEVRLSLKEECGVVIKRGLVCELGTRNELGLMAWDDPQKMSILESENVDGVPRCTVRVLKKLPHDVFRIAVAEALAQVWLEENVPSASILDDPDLREGFGLYVAWLFTKKDQLKRTKDMRKRLEEDGRFAAAARLLKNDRSVSNWRKYLKDGSGDASLKMPVKGKKDDKAAPKRSDMLKKVPNEEREERRAAAANGLSHGGAPDYPGLPPSPSNREDDLSNSQTLLRNGLRREHQVEQPPPSSNRENDLSRTQNVLRNGLRRDRKD